MPFQKSQKKPVRNFINWHLILLYKKNIFGIIVKEIPAKNGSPTVKSHRKEGMK